MTEQLKFCLNIVKDLLNKKNLVSPIISFAASHPRFLPVHAGIRLALCQTS
jgi:hypothetical protein